MMISERDLIAGKQFFWKEAPEYPSQVIEIVGFDPYERKWVAACPNWCMGISHLDEDDFKTMKECA